MWHTLVSRVSPWKLTPRSSSVLRAASTSSTCSATSWRDRVVLEAHRLRVDDAERQVARLELGEVSLGMYTERRRPSVSP